MKAINFKQVVLELNSEVIVNTGENNLLFTYSTNGFEDSIIFDGHILWDTAHDTRVIDPETNDYEPFKPYIKRLFSEYKAYVANIKFKAK